MNTAAGTARARTVIWLTSVCLAFSLGLAMNAADSSAAAGGPSNHPGGAQASGAQASIVNGKGTSIEDWPWQVALAISKNVKPRLSPQERTFCGGSLLAPDLVVTAGHCVADIKRSKVAQMSVISGRTYLNRKSTGKETEVAARYLPAYSSGRRKFNGANGAADWDVALLRLSRPVSSPSIRIAGNDERDSWATGQIVKTTGWGITSPDQRLVENRLRLATQVIQPEKICRNWDGDAFNPLRMVCFGAASIHSSACNGDSGGPLMAPVTTALGAEYRLVGLTSYGDGYCRGSVPSVDSRVADRQLRSWVKRTALEVSGADVIGHGGIAPVIRDWCQVPRLYGLPLSVAKQDLKAANCQLGKIFPDYLKDAPRGTVTFTNYLPRWLAGPEARVNIGLVR